MQVTAAILDERSQPIGHPWSQASREPPTREATERGRETSGLEEDAP
jgi:hypothetical protein